MSKLLIITQKVDKNDQLLGFFIDWIKLFAERFQVVTIFCLEKGQYDLPHNVKVLSLGKDKSRFKLFWLFNFYRFLFRERKNYDSVFVHMNPIWVALGGLLWRFMNKRIFLWYTHKSVTLKLRLAEKFANRIFTASKESFRLPSQKLIITGHGINIDLFAPDKDKKINDDILRILSVGRISPVKNYGTFISAAKILKNENIKFSVTIIGEPALASDRAYLKELHAEIQKAGLNELFDFKGKILYKDLVAFYQSHHLFVHLSRTGSVDKVLLEAMACGMQVLSSNDAAKGFLPVRLIFNDTSPAELAEKIKIVAHQPPDPALREYIVMHHELHHLIAKVSHLMQSDLSKTTLAKMQVVVYPFPFSQKSNRYIDLLYTAVQRQSGVMVQKSSLVGILVWRLRNWRVRHVIHIHWSVMLFGSRFLPKAVLRLIWNVGILSILKLLRVRIIWTMHNLAAHDFSYHQLDRIARWLFRNLANVIILQQRIVANQLAEENPGKTITYIPLGNYINAYGINAGMESVLRRRFGIADSDIVLLSLGLLRPYKHIEQIIDAVLTANVSGVRLIIAGPAKPAYAVQLRAKVANHPTIILVDSYIPDKEISGYFSLADWSVFWYDESTLTSASIMLSLSYGVPVICRNVPAADIITVENGIVFKDQADLIVLLKTLSQRPYPNPADVVDSVRIYDWDKIAEQTVRWYRY